MKRKIHVNSLLFKIVGTVVGGIICLAVILSFVNITMSKRVFVDSFAASQKKIFYEIDSEFYDFYADVADIMADISSNENLKTYITQTQENEVDEMRVSYLLEKNLKETKISDYNEMSAYIIGNNEKSYLYSNSDVFAVSKKEILGSSIADYARKNMDKIVCKYAEKGLTNVTKSEPVIILAKAWQYDDNPQMEAIAFITIKESDIRKMYSHFNSNTSDIVLLNQDNEVISSNNPAYFKETGKLAGDLYKAVEDMTEEKVLQKEVWQNGSVQTYIMQKMQSSRYKIIGVIKPDAAFAQQYDMVRQVLLTLFITAVMVFLITMFMRQQTKPLDRLVRTMRNSRQSKYREYVPVEGTYEVQELSATYNQMVDELDRYIKQLIQVENDKRFAEIHALQMQINPHYMYNTLASIKWLVWQGDTEKSTQVIDAFIQLLRNVIGNSDEFISIEQEVINLKNYVLINQVRYGEGIAVEFFVTSQCYGYHIPKLILQPFVENAFFHAFPEGRRGTIQIFIKEVEDNIQFEIVDNGIGITEDRLKALTSKDRSKEKSEHFTGIGINNVDERIKLIYGAEYGINIISKEEKGTTVRLLLKKK